MRPIQLTLLAGFSLAFIIYLRFLRSSLRDRLLAASMLLAVSVAVLVPDLTQVAADLVGVGRGTDLTLYLFIMGFALFGVLTYSKMSRLNRALTEVVRRLAIVESETGRTHADAVSSGDDSPDPARL
jgi:hypothetical protein